MIEETNVRPIWLVWNPQGSPPRYQHPSADSAHAEAERLAKVNPGQRFYILRTLAMCESQGVVWKSFYEKTESDSLNKQSSQSDDCDPFADESQESQWYLMRLCLPSGNGGIDCEIMFHNKSLAYAQWLCISKSFQLKGSTTIIQPQDVYMWRPL